MSSLQDQLLKAGLVDDKKAKQAAKEKRKKSKTAKHNAKHKIETSADEAKLAREKAKVEKAERDRALNKERDAAIEQKAIAAQILQLIENHKIRKHSVGEEQEYNFSDDKKIKKIIVDPKVNRQLVLGQVAVVKWARGYEIVPRVVAEKIQQRDASSVVLLNTQSGEVDSVEEDDPYKDYQIPDDLMW